MGFLASTTGLWALPVQMRFCVFETGSYGTVQNGFVLTFDLELVALLLQPPGMACGAGLTISYMFLYLAILGEYYKIHL